MSDTPSQADADRPRQVVLIGTGGIGSRLLQSLMTLSSATIGAGGLDVICVDPSETSLALARQRVAELSATTPGISVRYENRLPPDVQAEPDLAIVATPSAVRFAVVMNLLDAVRPRNLILEKFLFTQHQAYQTVGARLESDKIRTWVHAPRTVWPGYLDLVGRLSAGQPVIMRVSGSSWSLASNAIHFVPVFMLLSGEQQVQVDGSGLDPEALTNKRQGYREVSGRLAFEGQSGSRLELISLSAGRMPMLVTVETPSARYVIEEAAGRLGHQEDAQGWVWQQSPFRMLRASEMQEPLGRILIEGRSSLPGYTQMVAPHLALMREFNRIFFGPGHDTDDCPVT